MIQVYNFSVQNVLQMVLGKERKVSVETTILSKFCAHYLGKQQSKNQVVCMILEPFFIYTIDLKCSHIVNNGNIY